MKSMIITDTCKLVHSVYTVDETRVKTIAVNQQVGTKAFANEATTECVLFDQHATVIGESAFENCKELQFVQWTRNGEMLAFESTEDESKRMDNLFDVAEKLTVQYRAFKDCGKLYAVVFPKINGSLIIEKEAFAGCTSLRTVVLPWNGTFDIADDAFLGCDKDKLVFAVTKGSKAENFARQHGYRCVYGTNF